MKFFTVKTEEQAQELVRICPEAIAVDTEYIPGDPRTTKLTSIIIADDERSWIVEPKFLGILTPTLKARKAIFLQDYNHCDTIILLKHGCDLRQTNCYNLIDMVHLLDENLPKALGERVEAVYNDDYKTRLKGQYDNLEYQGKDGIYTYRLGISDYAELLARKLLPLYNHVRKTSLVLLETTLSGILVDEPLIRKTHSELSAKISEYLPKLRQEFKNGCITWELEKWEEEIRKRSSSRGKLAVTRPEFSFASDKQLRWLLYEYLKIPVESETKKGSPSTDYETLKLASERFTGLQTLVEYKETKSVFSTFVEGMLERIEDGRIYPHFNVSGTNTGRISHTNPNMGNLPTTGVIRNFFIPDKGLSIIGADYEQLEVIIEANLTEDKQLLKIVHEGTSKHDITAQGLGIDRDTAKTLNFALQYGADAKKVSNMLGISLKEAENVFKRYWDLYSGVRTLKEQTNRVLAEKGRVTNLFGRTRHFPKTTNKYQIAKQQRQAYNFLNQGVAGDICNRALCLFSDEANTNKDSTARVLFSVHDEIVAECITQDADYWKAKLIRHMESVSYYLNFKYPLKAKAYGPFSFWQKA